MRRALLPVLALALAAAPAAAQQHDHHAGMTHPQPAAAAPAGAGQAAFAAIAEVVALLSKDPATDWRTVSLERLRQHLIDMDAVTLRAEVAATDVPGGARFVVTGTGRTRDAIRRMAHAHTAMLGSELGYRATVADRPDGVTLTVLARDPSDAAAVARLRGLGFVGLLASGEHHGPHHLAIARGAMPPGHGH